MSDGAPTPGNAEQDSGVLRSLQAELDALEAEIQSAAFAMPDYKRIYDGLRQLLEQGDADAVVFVGENLRDKGLAQAGLFHDPSATADLAACLEVVFDALARSSLTPEARLPWALEALRLDPDDLCAGGYGMLESFDPEVWGGAADELLARLADRTHPAHKPTGRKERGRLVELTALALEWAGRDDEVVTLYVREARERRQFEHLLARLPGADRSLLQHEPRGSGGHDDMIAELLAQDYPERAAAIWQELAEAWIRGRGYGKAATMLRKQRQALEAAGRGAAWRAYLEGLRAENRRRPRLVATLDELLGEN